MFEASSSSSSLNQSTLQLFKWVEETLTTVVIRKRYNFFLGYFLLCILTIFILFLAQGFSIKETFDTVKSESDVIEVAYQRNERIFNVGFFMLVGDTFIDGKFTFFLPMQTQIIPIMIIYQPGYFDITGLREKNSQL